MLGSSRRGGGGSGNKTNSNNSNTMTTPWFPVPNSNYNFIVDPPSNSREMRNRAEKMRRDKLNSYIGELAQLVPMIARSAKRMDKTSILRLTATHLRIYQTLLNGNSTGNQIDIPKQVDQFLLEQLVSEQLGGFLLILSGTGKIIFVSSSVENLLGHLQTDLMGHSIYNIAAPEDRERLRMYISPDGLTDREWRKYFTVHLKKAGPRTESAVYEMCSVMGMQRPASYNNEPESSPSSSSSASTAPATSLNNNILVFFVKVVKPEPLVDQLIEASKEEYVTRHLVDGRIINCDQRISFIAGYMSEEVAGLSAFNFMHREDVRWVMIALRQMYDRGESRGQSCYRLLSRTGQFIYLRTYGYLEIDDTGAVESFVCINTLVSEEQAIRLIKEMKDRYSAMIKTSPEVCRLTSSGEPTSSVAEVEDPSQIEAAVQYLISSPGPNLTRSLRSPSMDSNSNKSLIESQDCSKSKTEYTTTNTTNTTTTTTTNKSYGGRSPSYHVLVKPPPKRPPSTELPAVVQQHKRRRNSPERAPPYSSRQQHQKISEISQLDDSMYHSDHLLRHNI